MPMSMNASNIAALARYLHHESSDGRAQTRTDDETPSAFVLVEGRSAPSSPMSPVSEQSFERDDSPFSAGDQTHIGKIKRPLGGGAKRLLDIFVASVALPLALPLMLVVAVVIMIRYGRPVIFMHRRIGYNGKPFNCYKFRTMIPDADRALEAYLANNPDAAREWKETHKLRHDPRVTLLGKVLRQSSADELPQLFNVLRGDMSCVGPRPIVDEELQRYGAAAADYLRTRPGVTGLWQVAGRSSVDYSQRVTLDSHYVRNWSIGYDLLILLRTAFAIIRFDDAA